MPAQKDRYSVFGDYGYTSECLLKDGLSYAEAVRFVKGYIRWGDFGGYRVIEIARHDPDGEYVVERGWLKSPEVDEEWDWNNTASPLHY